MQELNCGCSLDVQNHETESLSLLIAIKVVEWCVLHDVASVLLLGGEGSSTVKKKKKEKK